MKIFARKRKPLRVSSRSLDSMNLAACLVKVGAGIAASPDRLEIDGRQHAKPMGFFAHRVADEKQAVGKFDGWRFFDENDRGKTHGPQASKRHKQPPTRLFLKSCENLALTGVSVNGFTLPAPAFLPLPVADDLAAGFVLAAAFIPA